MACFGQRNVSRLEVGDVLEWLVLTPCAFAITMRKTCRGRPLIQAGGETRDTDPDHPQPGAKSGRAPPSPARSASQSTTLLTFSYVSEN